MALNWRESERGPRNALIDFHGSGFGCKNDAARLFDDMQEAAEQRQGRLVHHF
jgi:hypothetical protein